MSLKLRQLLVSLVIESHFSMLGTKSRTLEDWTREAFEPSKEISVWQEVMEKSVEHHQTIMETQSNNEVQALNSVFSRPWPVDDTHYRPASALCVAASSPAHQTVQIICSSSAARAVSKNPISHSLQHFHFLESTSTHLLLLASSF